MTVRELIVSLLDYDMENNVEVMISSDLDDDYERFEITGSENLREVYLKVELEGKSLVDTNELEKLEELAELKNS